MDNLESVAPHFYSRVAGRETLDLFSADVRWLGFLRAFSSQSVAFDVRLIADNAFGTLLHMATNGNLRAFKQLIVEAVLVAHDKADLALKRESFQQAFGLVFGQGSLRSNPFA